MGIFYGADSPYHGQEEADYCAPAVALSILSDSDVKLDLHGVKESVFFQAADGNAVLGWSVTPAGMEKLLKDKKPGNFKGNFGANFSYNELDGTARIVGQLLSGSGIAPGAIIWGKLHWVGINAVELANAADGSRQLLKLWVLDPFTLKAPNSDHGANENCGKFGVPDYFVFYPFGWRQMFTGHSEQGVQIFVTVELSGQVPAPAGGVISGSGINIIKDPNGKVVRDSIPDLWDSWLRIYGDWPQSSIAASYMPGSRALTAVTVQRLGMEGEWYLFPILKDDQLVGTGTIDARSGWPVSVALYKPDSEWRRHIGRLVGDLSEEVLRWRPCAESSTPHLPFSVSLVEDSFRNSAISEYRRIDGPIFKELSPDKGGR